MRELQGEQAKYEEVRQKLLDAQLSQNLESEQKGERFTLIEPPIQARDPVRPNRPAIFGIGLVLALGAAIGLLVLLEAMDTRVRGKRQLELITGVPPIAIIPWVAEEEAPRRSLRFWKRPPPVAVDQAAA
jgi:capsular polysaccharide biosynthesis protein